MQFDKLKAECLCSLEWLSAKLRATSLQQTILDFSMLEVCLLCVGHELCLVCVVYWCVYCVLFTGCFLNIVHELCLLCLVHNVCLLFVVDEVCFLHIMNPLFYEKSLLFSAYQYQSLECTILPCFNSTEIKVTRYQYS